MSQKQYSLIGSPNTQTDDDDLTASPDLRTSKDSKVAEKEGLKKSSRHRRSHSYASVPSGVSSWHNGPAIPELDSWRQGETLEIPWKRHAKNVALTAALLLFPAAYLGLGISVAVLHGQPIIAPAGGETNGFRRSKTFHTLQQIITVAVTLFPVIFALVIGKTLKTAAQYKAERGTTLLRIEQLVASKTFGSTLFAPLSFKRINVLGGVLLLLWLLSPLTTQALQRILSARSGVIDVRHQELYYLNTNNGQPGILSRPFSGVTDIKEQSSLDPLFLSQLMQPLSDAPVDVYGNPKVPLRSRVASLSSKDSQGYYDIRQLVKSVDSSRTNDTHFLWSSSVGIPIEGLRNDGVDYDTYTRFTIETSYWTFQCSPWEQITGLDLLSMTRGPRYRFMTNCGIDCVHQPPSNESMLASLVSLFFWISEEKNPQGYRFLKFGSRNGGFELGGYTGPNQPMYTTTDCEMRLEQVEANIVCEGKVCSVRRIRSSPPKDRAKPHPGIARMALRVLAYISPAQNIESEIGSSYLERWLFRPGRIVSDATPSLINWSLYPGTKQVNLTKIPIHEFEQRLGYAFTTFYELALGLFMIPRQLPSQLPSKQVLGNFTGLYKNTTGTISEKQTLYQCDWAWFAVLLVSCIVVIGAIFANTYMQFHVLGPDVLGYVSTVTQNNPFMPLPRGGSTMSGIDRAVRLADLKVRLQDIDPDGDVGHIALSSIDGQPLQNRRKYW